MLLVAKNVATAREACEIANFLEAHGLHVRGVGLADNGAIILLENYNFAFAVELIQAIGLVVETPRG